MSKKKVNRDQIKSFPMQVNIEKVKIEKLEKKKSAISEVSETSPFSTWPAQKFIFMSTSGYCGSYTCSTVQVSPATVQENVKSKLMDVFFCLWTLISDLV